MHYLISTAGHPNIGDELITRTWLREVARRDPDAEVWLDCPNPSNAQALFNDEHPRLKCVDTLFRLCWEAPSDEPWDVATFVADALDDHGRAPRWIPGLRVFARASTVHLLGGGYVNGMWPRHIGLLAAIDWAGRRGAVTAVTGQGFAPVAADSAVLIQQLLERVAVVDVRDEVSADLVGRPDSHVGDDLWLADRDTLVDGDRARHIDAVVCVQGDLLEVAGDLVAARCLEHLRAWDVDPARTAVVECIPRVDRPIFDKLRHALPGLQFVDWMEILRKGFPAAAHQRWFSSRFHPHLVASWTGARGVAIPVRSGYYDVKHASLLQAGSQWGLLDAGDGRVDDLTDQVAGSGLERTARRVRARKSATASFVYGSLPASAIPRAAELSTAGARR